MSIPRCQHCAGPMPVLARRHARFCSPRCRLASHRARRARLDAQRGLPVDLTDRPRWVRYRVVNRGARPTKVPITLAGRAASSTDQTTWCSFDQVRHHDRIGFVLTGDGIVCLDIDHCLDPAGAPAPWAAPILAALPATYTEVSPSGDGLHVWGTGTLARGRKVAVPGGTVECYGTGRYITVTAQRFGDCPTALADLSGVIAALT
jgi:primase-polymerase (primpol)-like protein